MAITLKKRIEVAEEELKIFDNLSKEDKKNLKEEIVKSIKGNISSNLKNKIGNIFYFSPNEDTHIFRTNFNGYTTDDGINAYIWIGFSNENLPVVVGATRFSNKSKSHGDFFDSYQIRLKNTSAAIISSILEKTNPDFKFYQKKENNEFEIIPLEKIFEEIKKEVDNFIVEGIIIPINLDKENFKNNKDQLLKIIDNIETEVGEIIIGEMGNIKTRFPLINKYSHWYTYSR